MATLADSGVKKAPPKMENTQKRDTLVEAEKKYQAQWTADKLYESNAPTGDEIAYDSITPAELRAKHPKFFATVPYPYTNGSLHLGHAFTISKAEFATRYERMQGKRTLFPFAFHCTGMPIKACADRLALEMEQFGKEFEGYTEAGEEGVEAEQEAGKQEAGKQEAGKDAPTDMSKFRSNKSKAAAKTIKSQYQFQIMLSQGIPRKEIQRFADPYHWVDVFPAAGMRDAQAFGLGVDWRRSFVTTEANLFYDSFVRWQMNRLHGLGKIKFGKRYTVYSPKDGQACMDHDRSEGEGVNVQEYTGIKMRVLSWPEGNEALKTKLEECPDLPQDADVYFVAATLRPETMYGQTCCFVNPKINYGLFATANEREFLFVSERAARNIAFQAIEDVSMDWGKYKKVLDLSGAEVIGTLVNAPLSLHKDGVRILPMETAKESKGTGVVTCVPSDSPDDYATTVELSNKPDYYKVQKAWASLEILPILETPTYGNLTAPALVKKMKINSPKDPKLPEAKEIAYKEGFYQGTMLIGKFAGRPVQEAKELVKQELLDSGDAFPYAEPDGLVISRSKDVCVAGHLDQWYLNYGTAENGGDGAWCSQVLDHLRSGNLNVFSAEAKRHFESTLGWLAQWACARSYGLGSKLPWDPQFLVESLSDSTIYNAYYTIAHYLHSDMYGQKPGLGSISVDQMTDEVWDYVFARADKPAESSIPLPTLQAMRREFQYWYPLDIRTSGKDLVQNHLTFFLYIHVAMFDAQYWPRGIRPNGHLLLNGEKMSKSTGNFLTLRESVDKFGADAARVAIADAGDGIDDANFEESVANKTILKLYELRKWLQDVLHSEESQTLRTGDDKKCYWDTLFEHHLRHLTAEAKAHYDNYHFKAALRAGFYDLTGARDFYRDAAKAAAIPMHADLVRRYAELQALLLAPLAPHWSEQVWRELLSQPQSILLSPWPAVLPADQPYLDALDYIQRTTSNVAAAESAQHKKLAKGKKTGFDPTKNFRVTIYFTAALPGWQARCLDLVTAALGELNVVDMTTLGKKVDKKESKRAMPFIKNLKTRLESGESKHAVLSQELPFDERTALREMVGLLRQMMGIRCEGVDVVEVGEGGHVVEGGLVVGEATVDRGLAEGAVPGMPTFGFVNVG